MAKHEGYRSRASFKLKQLDQRYKLFHPGDVVVDLGAAPGGWLQVARECVGRSGFVLGVDLQSIDELHYDNVVTLKADMKDPETLRLIKEALPRKADVVLSDASPKISGVWEVDHQRSAELAEAALSIAEEVLGPKGRALIKVFQGEMFEDLVRKSKQMFRFVKVHKPPASRKGSAEVYLVMKN